MLILNKLNVNINPKNTVQDDEEFQSSELTQDLRGEVEIKVIGYFSILKITSPISPSYKIAIGLESFGISKVTYPRFFAAGGR